jgi:hypothetical protein
VNFEEYETMMRKKSQRRRVKTIRQALNQYNFTKIEALGFNPRGAYYWHIKHGSDEYMEEGDYALVELADGSVLSWVYIASGMVAAPTPLAHEVAK